MMKPLPRKQTYTRTTRMQYEKMVDIMETAPEIARALFKGNQSAFWGELAENLNALGPPIKAVWFDYKCAVKKKLRDNKASLNATGGGPCRTKTLNELEERVASLTNLRATVVGNNAARFGIGRPNNANISQESNNDMNTDNLTGRNNNVQQQQDNPEQHDQQEQQVQYEHQEQQIRQISGPSTRENRATRKRKATEAVLLQNKAMLEMMAKFVECQENSMKLMEENSKAIKKCTEQLEIFNDILLSKQQ
uniref:Regulatory protein zeste n=1 Tax=Anopheles minimus TaxID=112268 RepID=A0A182W7Z8_9DIPT